MFCNKCGAQIPDGADFCNKCGTPVSGGTPNTTVQHIHYNQPPTNPPQPNPGLGLGIASMVMGILGVLGCWIPIVNIFTGILAIIGIILAAISIKKTPLGSSKGMAIAGLVCSIIGTVFGLGGWLCIGCFGCAAQGAAASTLPYYLK